MGYSNKKYAYTNKIYYVQNCTLKKKNNQKRESLMKNKIVIFH